MTTKEKNGPSREELVRVIEKFVKEEKYSEKNFWSKEIGICQKLCKAYSYEALNFLVLGYKLNSLAFLLSSKGKAELEKTQKNMKLLEVKKNVDNFDQKEYVRVTEKQPRSLKERLIN
jgi:hypothetical protein